MNRCDLNHFIIGETLSVANGKNIIGEILSVTNGKKHSSEYFFKIVEYFQENSKYWSLLGTPKIAMQHLSGSKAGIGEAAFNLDVNFVSVYGVRIDTSAGVDWLVKSANRGYFMAHLKWDIGLE
ncbi:13000_t:CDS:2 [Ambispora gerdemannii]|uniref:13000_t:CDS:1 n=1 Tax=Ambispora gerdemannii TaxID=144530 RepID=A0A9N9FFH6_9GLOM|nr:13000_t:CDS:2 [Ambispora gerdemannii]